MATRDLTLSVPELLLDQLIQRAEHHHRSVEEETVELLMASVPGDTLEDHLASAIAPLKLLDLDSLRRAAGNHLPAETARKLEAFHFKQQREGLTPSERDSMEALMQLYERAMLVRATAAAILKERGELIPIPDDRQ